MSLIIDGTAVSSSVFGSGTGIIHMDNILCNGTEQNLVDCSYSRDTVLDSHAEDVGVRCIVGE